MGRRTVCTHSVQLWQLHGQKQAAMPRLRLPHKRSVELPLPLVRVHGTLGLADAQKTAAFLLLERILKKLFLAL